VRDSLSRVVAPALPLKRLLAQGPELGRKLRERIRRRRPQMEVLADLIQNGSN